jgi:hypothetical protein
MIFLPGVDQRTAEYASKRLGTTTVLQSTSVDVRRGDEFDSARSSEVGRHSVTNARNDDIAEDRADAQSRARRAGLTGQSSPIIWAKTRNASHIILHLPSAYILLKMRHR